MNKKIKIQIKNRCNGNIIFEYEKENNTIKDTLEEAVRQNIDLSYSDLMGSNLSKCDLRGSNLRGSDLSGIDLSYSDLSNSDLSYSDLTGSNLRYSNLSTSDLSGSNLRYSDLTGSNLSGIDLSYSDLTGSNLSASNLSGIDLIDSDLIGSYIYCSDEEFNAEEKIKEFEEKTNIKIKEYNINQYVHPTRWSCFWSYGLIIKDWEMIDEKEENQIEDKKFNLENATESKKYLYDMLRKIVGDSNE